MPITTDFEGTALPAEWTFVPNSAANATLDVSGGFATITIPAGQSADSISSTSSPDQTAGLITDVSGDFDVAVMVGTDVAGQSSSMFGFIIRGATDAEMVRWTLYGNTERLMAYGYARSGGSGSAFQSSNVTNWFYGSPSWVRVARVSGTYFFYGSADGVNWTQISTVNTAVDGLTLKLTVGQYSALLGLPFLYSKVVDVLAAGTTDCRSVVPDLVQSSVLSTDLTTLPAWLSLDTRVDGTAILNNGAVELSTVPSNGSSGRLVFSGTGYSGNAGMLFRLTSVVNDSLAYVAAGLAVQDGGPNLDMYAAGPLAGGLEINTNTTWSTIPIRVKRPIAVADFNESYTFLGPSASATPAGTWWRIERYGDRLRIRQWNDGAAEPTTWIYDGQDPQEMAGLGPLVPYFSISHNDGSAATATVAVQDVTFYELSSEAPPDPPAEGGLVFVTETQLNDLTTAISTAVNNLKAASWTYVDARTDNTVSRPTGWAGVIWLADATGNPTNAVSPDIIIREDEAV